MTTQDSQSELEATIERIVRNSVKDMAYSYNQGDKGYDWLPTIKAISEVTESYVTTRVKEAERLARIDAAKDATQSAIYVLTGSDDFRIEPGVDLGLSMGQITKMRQTLYRMKDAYQAQALTTTTKENTVTGKSGKVTVRPLPATEYGRADPLDEDDFVYDDTTTTTNGKGE